MKKTKKKKRNQTKESKPSTKIFSKEGFGHATQAWNESEWNVWFHWDTVSGQSKCVANNVTLDVANQILEEIDKTGANLGKAKGN